VCHPVAGIGQSRAQPVARASAGRQATPPAPGPTSGVFSKSGLPHLRFENAQENLTGREKTAFGQTRCPSTPRSPAPRQSFAWRRDRSECGTGGKAGDKLGAYHPHHVHGVVPAKPNTFAGMTLLFWRPNKADARAAFILSLSKDEGGPACGVTAFPAKVATTFAVRNRDRSKA
jgi:hypothetical protein